MAEEKLDVSEEVGLAPVGNLSELIKSMIAFKAACPQVVKDATNLFFEKKYITLDAILAVVNSELAPHGLMVYQWTIPKGEDVLLVTCVYHESGCHLPPMLYPLYPEKAGDSQKAAAALTYGLRQSLKAVLSVGAGDDDDAESTQNRGDRPSNGNGQAKTHPGQQKQPEQPASGEDKDTKLAIRTRILGKEIGIEDVKVFLGLETSKSLTQEEWAQLEKDFKKYKTSATWLAAQISKDLPDIAEFAAHRAGDWPMLYPDIKKAKDALEKGKDESLRDELWSEFTQHNKSKAAESEADSEDAADLLEAKTRYAALIDGREGWETPAKRITEEAKLSDKLYPVWGMDEHLNAITALEAEDKL